MQQNLQLNDPNQTVDKVDNIDQRTQEDAPHKTYIPHKTKPQKDFEVEKQPVEENLQTPTSASSTEATCDEQPSSKILWEKVIPTSLQHKWKTIMGKVDTFHKNGVLIPINNPSLTAQDHYDNMSTDHYRQVPTALHTKLQSITKERFNRIFRYVPQQIYIDTDKPTNEYFSRKAIVQRFRSIPRDTRVALDKVLNEILYFHHTGLLVPTENSKLHKYDHFRNLKKTNERRVPLGIFNRLRRKSNNELIALFPRTAGNLTIKNTLLGLTKAM